MPRACRIPQRKPLGSHLEFCTGATLLTNVTVNLGVSRPASYILMALSDQEIGYFASRALMVSLSPQLQKSLLHGPEPSMSKCGALRLIPKTCWSRNMAGRYAIYLPRCLKYHYGSECPVIYVGLGLDGEEEADL